jgi:N utilization substance protein A
MEVIVIEDQLSLAIGKRGQNVRLATRLVGWDIDIVSEDVLKKEIAQKMGKMMASGEAVPITALQIVSSAQAEDLKKKGISDVDTLATTSVDDLVDFLDISLDEAEKITASARGIVEVRNTQSKKAEAEDATAQTSDETSEISEAQADNIREISENAEENIPERDSAKETDSVENDIAENELAKDSDLDVKSLVSETVTGEVVELSEDSATINNSEENLSKNEQ